MGTVGIDITEVVTSSETYEKADDATLKINISESDLATLDVLKLQKQRLESNIVSIEKNKQKAINELNLVNKRIVGAELLGIKDIPIISPPIKVTP